HVEPTQEQALAYVTQQLAGRQAKRPVKGLPMRGWRQRFLEGNPLGRWLVFRGAERILRRKVPDDMPAPGEALQAVRVGMSRGMAAGLAYEREAIGRLATTTACRNLVTLFFLIENARKGPEAVPGSAPKTIRRVGVVGAGAMGAGIAQLAAIKGFDVVIQEVHEEALAAGVQKVFDLFQKAAAKGVLPAEEARRKVAAIGKTTSWEGFADVDLVIEAVVEDLNLKRGIFRELELRTRPDTI